MTAGAKLACAEGAMPVVTVGDVWEAAARVLGRPTLRQGFDAPQMADPLAYGLAVWLMARGVDGSRNAPMLHGARDDVSTALRALSARLFWLADCLDAYELRPAAGCSVDWVPGPATPVAAGAARASQGDSLRESEVRP